MSILSAIKNHPIKCTVIGLAVAAVAKITYDACCTMRTSTRIAAWLNDHIEAISPVGNNLTIEDLRTELRSELNKCKVNNTIDDETYFILMDASVITISARDKAICYVIDGIPQQYEF